MAEYDLKRGMEERYKEALPMWQAWWVQADMDTRIALGDQSLLSRYTTTNTRTAKQLYFNKVLRVLNMISGYQRKNRLSSIAIPIEGENQQLADDFSACLQWAMQVSNSYHTVSDAFEGCIQSGLNMLSVWMDYRNDPENGDLKVSRLGYNSFIMDPFWTNTDMSDCSWIWTRRWLSGEEVTGLYPDLEDELPQLQNANQGYSNRGNDMKFLFQPQATYIKIKDMFAYDEYWTQEHRNSYKILDMMTGEMAPWKYGVKEFKEFKERVNPLVKLLTVQTPTVKRNVLVNGQLVFEEKRPWSLDRMPFVPVVCYHSPDVMYYEYRLQGVVRGLRDSQIELNVRRNKMLDVLDSQINSGFIIKEDALVRAEDVFMTGQGRALFVKDTCNIPTDVVPIPAPPIPSGDMDMQTLLEKEIMENAGTTEELFGQGDKEMSGISTQLRQGAALVGLQGIFDKLNLSQKHLGNIFLDLIQGNFSEAKVERIIKRKPVEEFYTPERNRLFDVAIEQGLLTTTQKQMEFAQMLQLRELGIMIPDDVLLEKSTLQNKKDLVEAVQRQQQQQQQQQEMQIQVEMRKLQSETELLDSNSENMRASARERETRAVSNIGLAQERIAQADQDRAQASLDNAKALREIEELDVSNLTQLAALLQQLQQSRDLKQKSELQKTEAEAGAVGSQAQRK